MIEEERPDFTLGVWSVAWGALTAAGVIIEGKSLVSGAKHAPLSSHLRWVFAWDSKERTTWVRARQATGFVIWCWVLGHLTVPPERKLRPISKVRTKGGQWYGHRTIKGK